MVVGVDKMREAFGEYGRVVVYWEEPNTINKESWVKIGWSAPPSQPIEEVEEFIVALKEAVVFAKEKRLELKIDEHSQKL